MTTVLPEPDDAAIPRGDSAVVPPDGGPIPEASVVIAPRVTTILVGRTFDFTATIQAGTDPRVTFSVVEADGCGAIDNAGHYTAPDAVPAAEYCHVRATSVAYSAHDDATVRITDTASSGTPGVWTQAILPADAVLTGDGSGGVQTIVVDPVRPSDFYAFVNTTDSQSIVVLRSTDFGVNWESISQTPEMRGTPWGAAIDPNPDRDPATPPTLYSPAGFGAQGLWKSIDGGVHWTNTLAGDTVFDPYSPYGPVDVYGIRVLPDDPPNHILFTYHYGFDGPEAPQVSDGGFGESTDGGLTWSVHVPPEGIGNSHYLIPIDASTWLVIAQENGGENGMWRTTTAGRVGGVISTAAWTRLNDYEHVHGAFEPYIDPLSGAVFVPSSSGMVRSMDRGTTWDVIFTGRTSGVAATETYLYSNYRYGPNLVRAPRAAPDDAFVSYADSPPELADRGSPPYGSATSFDGEHWVVLMGGHITGLWRFVEPVEP